MWAHKNALDDLDEHLKISYEQCMSSYKIWFMLILLFDAKKLASLRLVKIAFYVNFIHYCEIKNIVKYWMCSDFFLQLKKKKHIYATSLSNSCKL